MTTTYVTFDKRSGRILSAHHGAVDAKHAQNSAKRHARISDEHIEMITVSADDVERGKQYRVDAGRKKLVAVEGGEDGIGFGFGASGRSS